MRVCVLHATKDLRLEERPETALGPDQVRVRFGAGGICGSDLHYYYEGRVGDFALREPLILGHEVAGEVIETGRARRPRPARRPGRGQPEPALLAMPRLSGRADQPLPAHDLLRQRRGLSPHSRRVPGAAGVLREPVPRGPRKPALRDRGARRAARGLPARGPARGRPARPEPADHRLWPDRRAHLHGREAGGRRQDHGHRHRLGAARGRKGDRRRRDHRRHGGARRGSRPIPPTRAGSTSPSRPPAVRRRCSPASTACTRAAGSCSSACCRAASSACR